MTIFDRRTGWSNTLASYCKGRCGGSTQVDGNGAGWAPFLISTTPTCNDPRSSTQQAKPVHTARPVFINKEPELINNLV